MQANGMLIGLSMACCYLVPLLVQVVAKRYEQEIDTWCIGISAHVW